MYSDSKLVKKILTIALAVIMILPYFGVGSFASEDDSLFCVFEEAKITQDCDVHCGVGDKFDVISTLKTGDTVKVLARIQNWCMIYDYSTACTGAVKSDNLSMIDRDLSDTETVTPLTDEEKFLNMVNGARSELNLHSLEASNILNKLAFYKARDIVENNNFSHNSISYGNPFEMMRAEGVVFTVAGENISGNQTIDGAFYSMMSSDANKDNILNNEYTTTGIGIYTSPVYGKVIVQLFTGE